MTNENETTEMWKEVHKEKQAKHIEWFARNKQTIIESGIPFTDKGETLLFRQQNKPAVDFYPSTGRWKTGKQFMRGGAKAFLAWYKKQEVNG